MDGRPMLARWSRISSNASWRMKASIFFNAGSSPRSGCRRNGARAARSGARVRRHRDLLRVRTRDVDEALRVAEHAVLGDVQAAQLLRLGDAETDGVLDRREDDQRAGQREADRGHDAVE